MKICKECKEEKHLVDFYSCGINSSGEKRYDPKCKVCRSAANRSLYQESDRLKLKCKLKAKKYRENPDNVLASKIRSDNFYYSLRGRAKTLLKSAERRSSKFAEFDIDLDFILDKMSNGVCDVTGIEFSYDKPNNTSKNPYAPSIDRIDSNVGYTKKNTQIVIWQYNLMKGEISHSELIDICKVLVEGLADE